MPLRLVHKYEFNTGAGSQTLTDTLAALDLSRADLLKVTVSLTKALTDAGDTLNVYLQSRGASGIWEDRIAFTQLLGNMTVSVSAPEVLQATLAKYQDYSDDEEESEATPGSAGASHLTAGTVRHGAFPGPYRSSGEEMASAWRLVLDVVDGDGDADFEGVVYVEADSPY